MAANTPTLVLRLTKQQPLTALEMDNNLTNLKQYALDVETQLSDGTTSLSALNLAGNASLGDNNILNIGAGNDLRLYHDSGTGNSYIEESGGGDLRIKTTSLRVRNAGDTEDIIAATADGSVALYYDSALKAETSTSGIVITGDVLPEANNTRSLGSSTTKWTNIHSTTVTGDLTGDVTGDLTGNVTGNVTGQASDISNHDTDALSEGATNQYFTNSRARGALSATSGEIDYDSSTGLMGLPDSGVTAATYGSTTAIPEITVDAKGRITGVTEQSNPAPQRAPRRVQLTSTTTWTVPSGVTEIYVEMVGGGGGFGSNSRGGGGGAYVATHLDVTAGSTITFTVGSGGTTTHGAGGNTTFTHDSTTYTAGGAGWAAGHNAYGTGGVASGGEINVDGFGALNTDSGYPAFGPWPKYSWGSGGRTVNSGIYQGTSTLSTNGRGGAVLITY